jgi:hypothetical protein
MYLNVHETARLLKVSAANASEIRQLSAATADLHSSIDLLARLRNEGALTRVRYDYGIVLDAEESVLRNPKSPGSASRSRRPLTCSIQRLSTRSKAFPRNSRLISQRHINAGMTIQREMEIAYAAQRKASFPQEMGDP